MTNRLGLHGRHFLNLTVYLVLAAVVVVALFGYQHHVTGRFEKADRVSCKHRLLVLRYLYEHTGKGDIDALTGRPWYVEFADALPECRK